MIDTTTSQGPAGDAPDPSTVNELTQEGAEPAPAPAAEAGPGIQADAPTDADDAGRDGTPDDSGAATTDTTVAAEPETVEPTTVEAVAAGSDPDSHRFECRSCGYVYDPAEGVRKLAIEPGTPFSALDPVSFRCPVCRSKTLAFRDIGPRDKPSGFEENLNFGLGVNRLTPGQKNVLIFGGFALAFAFFLSLYSLR